MNRGPACVGIQVATFVHVLTEELIPWAEAQVAVDASAARRGVMGTSNGDYLSARLGRDRPGHFQRTGSQSGALAADGGNVFGSYRAGVAISRLYADLGVIADFVTANQVFRDALETAGTAYRYAEFPEGYSWGNWRVHLDDLLRFLFLCSP